MDKESSIIVIYVIPGSQFSYKVLAALDARQIPHHVEFVPVPLEARRAVLPSGGTMVPEMEIRNNGSENQIVVPDSEAILHWLDDNHHLCQGQTKRLFPTEQASQLSLRASTKGLAGLVWYYNWVNSAGYKASMRQYLATVALPSWVPFGRGFIVDCMVTEHREKHAKLAMEALDIRDRSVLEDEKQMEGLLMEELSFFQSLFGNRSSTEQPFLLQDSTEPTAADFSVYAQLQRLVGTGPASSDVPVFPALADFREHNDEKYGRLFEWYDLMCERCPVKFKGKRIPKST